jgi:peptide/nickel transport system substrate-binding protein
VPVDPNDEYANLQKGQYEIGFDYFTTDIVDPDEWVSYTAMGGESGQQTKANFTFYDNPEVDAWAQQAETTFDQSQRQVLYSKIQAQIARDVPLAPLYCSPFNYAYRSNVKGFVVYPSGFYPLAQVSLG